jgi:hypothetical protein
VVAIEQLAVEQPHVATVDGMLGERLAPRPRSVSEVDPPERALDFPRPRREAAAKEEFVSAGGDECLDGIDVRRARYGRDATRKISRVARERRP